VIDEAPLQVYTSALIFSPEKSIVRITFENQFPSGLLAFPTVNSRWEAWNQILDIPDRLVMSIVFSPSGDFVATTAKNGTLRLWSFDTGQCQQVFHIASRRKVLRRRNESELFSVIFSPDSKLVAPIHDFSDGSRYNIPFWSVDTGECRYQLNGHSGIVHSISYSPGNTVLASASSDASVRLWSADTGNCERILEGHTNIVRFVQFSHDGKLIASASDDSAIRLWATDTGQCYKIFDSRTATANSLVFISSSKRIACSYVDDTICVWDTDTGLLLHPCERKRPYIGGPYPCIILFSPGGELLATVSDTSCCVIELWSIEMAQRLFELAGHTRRVILIAFSHDGKLMASTAWDGTIRVWATDTGQCLSRTSCGTIEIKQIAISPNNGHLATQTIFHDVHLWEGKTGCSHYVSHDEISNIGHVAVSPDGQLVAATTKQGHICVVDALSGKLQYTRTVVDGPSLFALRLAFSPDGRLMAATYNDETVRLWTVDTGEHIRTLIGHTKRIKNITFSPEIGLLATLARDHTLRLWSVTTGRCMHTLNCDPRFEHPIVFSPDGYFVAVQCADDILRIWVADTGQCHCAFQTRLIRDSFEIMQENSTYYIHSGFDVLRAYRFEKNGDHQRVWISSLPIRHSPTRLDLDIYERWVVLGGIRLFRLPTEVKPRNFAISKSTVAIACDSGRLVVFMFAGTETQQRRKLLD
jgi:WD40 repeat protein